MKMLTLELGMVTSHHRPSIMWRCDMHLTCDSTLPKRMNPNPLDWPVRVSLFTWKQVHNKLAKLKFWSKQTEKPFQVISMHYKSCLIFPIKQPAICANNKICMIYRNGHSIPDHMIRVSDGENLQKLCTATNKCICTKTVLCANYKRLSVTV